jgi:hypothetical protein
MGGSSVNPVLLETGPNVAMLVAKESTMQMLYDSDAFVVVHMQANEPAEGEPPRGSLGMGLRSSTSAPTRRSISTAPGPRPSSARSTPGS